MAHSLPRRAPCPICLMPVNTQGAEFTVAHGGRMHLFCAESCRQKFLAERCCEPTSKGWWGRYMDRLAQANEGEFGPSGPKCH